MDRVIRFSSGLTGRVRNFTGGDFHELLNQSASTGSATPEQMAALADRVWLETIDRGPYHFEGDRPPFNTGILLGDRSHVLIQARLLTDEKSGRPSSREIKIPCGVCTRWFPDVFDYAELEYRMWPTEDPGEDAPGALRAAWRAREQFANGQPCETKMADGTTVRWNLLTGELLAGPLRDYAEQFGQTPHADTAARIHSIDGIDLEGKTGKVRRKLVMGYVCDTLSDSEFWDLWLDIQDQECGPETSIDKNCPFSNCAQPFEHGLSITDFIVPGPPTRSRRLRAGHRRG